MPPQVETIKIGARVCLTFGRNEHQCDIALAHQSISRQHAAIVHDRAGNVQLLDLGSTHGTFAGGKRLEQHAPLILKEGDVLTFGGSKREYKVRLGAGASQVAAENEARGSFRKSPWQGNGSRAGKIASRLV